MLDGGELASYIKERQAKQVRNLRQGHGIVPRLVIVRTLATPVIDAYVRYKELYGADILIDVEVRTVESSGLIASIQEASRDDSVHGVIVQLPLADTAMTDEALHVVAATKDIDGLGDNTTFTPATALAIDWLVNGYNIDLQGKKIAIVGQGRLVGAPLTRLWRGQGFDVTVFDLSTADSLLEALPHYDVVVTATGTPRLITSAMIKEKAVVIDAATASENGKLVGDVADDLRERQDITITPIRGGVGPLTVCALFDNVIQAARATIAAQ